MTWSYIPNIDRGPYSHVMSFHVISDLISGHCLGSTLKCRLSVEDMICWTYNTIILYVCVFVTVGNYNICTFCISNIDCKSIQVLRLHPASQHSGRCLEERRGAMWSLVSHKKNLYSISELVCAHLCIVGIA